jgi:hypothetical protein
LRERISNKQTSTPANKQTSKLKKERREMTMRTKYRRRRRKSIKIIIKKEKKNF